MRRIPCLIVLLLATLQVGYSNPQESGGFLGSVTALTQWETAGERLTLEAETYLKSNARNSIILNEYGFVRLIQQDFAKEGEKIKVEVFEMIDSAAAYGYYTFVRELEGKPLEKIGNIGQDLGQSMEFAQNRYFVRLTAPGHKSSLHAGLLKIGYAISQLLPTRFSTPEVIGRLPRENLVRNSAVFVMGFRALVQRYPFLGNDDIFGLANGAEAVVADYRFLDDSATLLLISYPTQQLAKKSLENGYQSFAARNPDQPVFYKREGPLAALVFGSKSAEVATTLLDRISYASMVSWDPKAQPQGVARMMLNIFLYTGIMLSISLVAGILFGLFRITVKMVLPGRVFDRPESTQLIRLNLQVPKE